MTSQKKPDFFIVGAPKCGTTSLCYYLAQHPEIFISKQKEPNFFNSDIIDYDRDLGEYLNLFSEHSHQLCGEGSVWYLYSTVAAKAIKQFNPQAKIIIALRDPASFIESLHGEHQLCGYETIDDLPKAIEAEELRKSGKLKVRSSILERRWYCKDWFLYRKVAHFSDQVKRYFDHFESENIHVITFDDLQENTAEEYKKLLCFLNVEDLEFKPNFRAQRVRRQIRNPKIYRFFALPPNRLINFLNKLTPRRLEPFFSKVGWRIVGYAKQLLTKPKDRKSVDLEYRHQLKHQFRSEIEELSKLINRDLSHWS